jgi:hypothetical protein
MKRKNLNMIKKRKQLNDNPEMQNLKFLTSKKHNAFTWKDSWIDIYLRVLNFKTQVGLKENQDKTKQIVKKEKKSN